MNIAEMKTQLNIFEIKGGYQMMIDLLRYFDKEINGKEEDSQYYLLYIKGFKGIREKQLTQEIAKHKGYIQKTLEEEIEDCQTLNNNYEEENL